MSSGKPVRIPFDSLVLAAVVDELKPYVGGKVQRISQSDEFNVALGLYAGGKEASLLVCVHPQFARAHLSTRRLPNAQPPLGLCQILRSRLDGARIASIRQIEFDRILQIDLLHSSGEHTLIAELMGRNSNLILLGPDGRVLGAAKWVGRAKSPRPIQPGVPYQPPPGLATAHILEAAEAADIASLNGVSPFLLRMISAIGIEPIQRVVRTREWRPSLSPGHGAYPISVAPLGLNENPRDSISVALEQHFEWLVAEQRHHSLQASLLSQLERVLLARDVALRDLAQARTAAERAPATQMMAELILAYGAALPPGASELAAQDYDGREVRISLDPDLTYLENANRYFERAKRAKSRAGLVSDQIVRLEADRAELLAAIDHAKAAAGLRELERVQEEASRKKWLHRQPPSNMRKEERPYEGHRIREVIAPGGWSVLYGENAEANDYLTLRVSRPNDIWVHVRGGISAHVVISTRNQPERVQRDALMFAANVAVQNSPSKHAGYVPVDYTLRKYVRKPRGAPKGTALYTHEKTLHVEGK